MAVNSAFTKSLKTRKSLRTSNNAEGYDGLLSQNYTSFELGMPFQNWMPRLDPLNFGKK